MTQGRRVASFGREYQDNQTRRLDASTPGVRSRYRDRRRFCGGHEGREHVWTLGKVYDMRWTRVHYQFHREVCANCGKTRTRNGLTLAHMAGSKT